MKTIAAAFSPGRLPLALVGAILSHAASFVAAQPSTSPVINEFSASTAGTDVEFVEIFGPPNTDLSG